MPRARHPQPHLTHHDGEGTAARPWARFDDLTAGGRSFVLDRCSAQLVARATADVVDVIDAAADAARSGRWVAGFVAYEAAAGLDPVLRVGEPAAAVPLVWFGVFDRWRDCRPVRAQREVAAAWTLEWGAAAHARRVAHIKDRIVAGDTYQVNLTARAHAVITDPLVLYSSMAVAQLGAHNAFIETGTHAVVCASPELFFTLDGDDLATRPMKGTARRGRWPEEDEARAEALAASAKDRAENVMIVDLTRNDIGRLARTGSVGVTALAHLERYPTVWQLTSTVIGRLRPGVGLGSVFRAMFPAGSVTGAPKASTMALIAALEDSPRGVYCGAVGWIAPGSRRRASFAVAIRTATVENATGRATYGAGGAITWPSDSGAEWDELAAKMKVLDHPPLPPGLLETMPADARRGPVRLEHHLARMRASARYFSIPFDEVAVRAAVAAAPAPGPGRYRVRVTLAADGAVAAEASCLPTATPASDGCVILALAGEPVDSRDPWLFHKTTDRARYDDRRATAPEAHDVILRNERDELTETTTATLVVLIDGRWWTPPLESGLLPGIARAVLLRRGAVGTRVISVADLRGASALAVVNSLRGWRPASLMC